MSGPRHRQIAGEGMVAAGSAETLKVPAGQNIYLWAISFVAALGGLLFGYDWVVIGGAKPFYEKFFHLTDAAQQGWAMSCALIGRSEEHTSELQSHLNLVCRLLLENKKMVCAI